MKVKILGSGCAKCNHLERKVRQVVEENHLQDVIIEKVTDLNKLLDYGIRMTPVLVIDEEVKIVGNIPRDSQLLSWLHQR